MFKLSIVILLVIFSGCASNQMNSKKSPVSIVNIGYHGNFCGPGKPKLPQTDPSLRYAALVELNTIDALDEVCKQHDICYLQNGYGNKNCDAEFVVGFTNVTGRSSLSIKCTFKVSNMLSAITLKDPRNWWALPLHALSWVTTGIFNLGAHLSDNSEACQ